MGRDVDNTRLFRELSLGRIPEILARCDEAPRESPSPTMRRNAAPNCEHSKLIVSDGEHHEVNRERARQPKSCGHGRILIVNLTKIGQRFIVKVTRKDEKHGGHQ